MAHTLKRRGSRNEPWSMHHRDKLWKYTHICIHTTQKGFGGGNHEWVNFGEWGWFALVWRKERRKRMQQWVKKSGLMARSRWRDSVTIIDSRMERQVGKWFRLLFSCFSILFPLKLMAVFLTGLPGKSLWDVVFSADGVLIWWKFTGIAHLRKVYWGVLMGDTS